MTDKQKKSDSHFFWSGQSVSSMTGFVFFNYLFFLHNPLHLRWILLNVA